MLATREPPVLSTGQRRRGLGGHGESTWFEGLMLLALYTVLAAAFLFA